jgi:hypothetical protein
MAARQTEINNDEHKAARRFGSHIGWLVAKVIGNRSHQVTTQSGQLAAATAREFEQQISDSEAQTDLVFKMQPLSRRHIKVRVLGYRDAEPRFAYDELTEETAAAK